MRAADEKVFRPKTVDSPLALRIMTQLELLAPAKNLETGIAAVMHGADAVYIAAEQFGAREKAGNSIADIKSLVDFAHQFHARVYVTVNTIIFEDELLQVEELIKQLHGINVDAIIIQDFAILTMDIPPIALHASTQMHNISPERVQFLESYGINRIVLPRELTLDEIAVFRKNTSAELEAFVHGSLCVSYSGQCYLSQAITGRSANRGACAQPCRSAYNLVDEDGKYIVRNKHLLSLKDLNLHQHIAQLVQAGVTSFKIEGRMKDVPYVKNITALYSMALNKFIANNPAYRRQSAGQCTYTFTPDPERSFNRGFTSYFIEGRKSGQSSMHTQKSTGKPLGSIAQSGNGIIKVDSKEQIHTGDGLCFLDKGELKGFFVNNIQGSTIRMGADQPIPPKGATIYRNYDHTFEKQLRGNSSKRHIDVSLTINATSNFIAVSATDHDGNTAEAQVPNTFQAAHNTKGAIENTINQLSKTGDTIFRVTSVDTTHYTQPLHMPISAINTLRRDVLNKLLSCRVENHKPIQRNKNITPKQYPHSEVTFMGNVANSRSMGFLASAGVASCKPAFEITQPAQKVELMTTRYCIKYELNMCPRFQQAEPTKQLYLEDSNKKYLLQFDCNICHMKVIG